MVDEPALSRVRTGLMQADGHCLYRAVGDQLTSHTNGTAETEDLWAIRAKAAAYMRAHPDRFIPFLPEACSSPALLMAHPLGFTIFRFCLCHLPVRKEYSKDFCLPGMLVI